MLIDPLLALAIYVVCWWITLFAVLPIGVRGVHEATDAPPGHEPGAPQAPNLKRKALWTTGIAFFVWLLVLGLIFIDPMGIRAAGFATAPGPR